MASFIPPDFTPSDQSYKNLQGHGIHKDFIDWELQNFIDYWVTARDEGKDAKKKNWQVTLQNWMKRSFQGSAGKRYEEIRHLRRDNGQQGDIFAATLDKLKAPQDTTKPRSPRLQPLRVLHSPIPGEGKKLKTEDALEQLRKLV